MPTENKPIEPIPNLATGHALDAATWIDINSFGFLPVSNTHPAIKRPFKGLFDRHVMNVVRVVLQNWLPYGGVDINEQLDRTVSERPAKHLDKDPIIKWCFIARMISSYCRPFEIRFCPLKCPRIQRPTLCSSLAASAKQL
jgi:hypothetical protein